MSVQGAGGQAGKRTSAQIAEGARDIAEQTLDGTLPYEETWHANAQAVVEFAAVIDWLLPAVAYRGQYGMSSNKLVRHCLLDEPLNESWERPWDWGDLYRATVTAEAAPAHLADKAQAALTQFRAWLEPHHIAKADRELARRNGAPRKDNLDG